MVVLYLYALFALTTAIAALYEIIYPVILTQELAETHVNDKFLIYASSFVIFLLIAPVVFFACVVPSVGVTYREYIHKGLFVEA